MVGVRTEKEERRMSGFLRNRNENEARVWRMMSRGRRCVE